MLLRLHLFDPDIKWARREQCVELLGRCGKPCVPVLTAIMLDKKDSDKARCAAAFVERHQIFAQLAQLSLTAHEVGVGEVALGERTLRGFVLGGQLPEQRQALGDLGHRAGSRQRIDVQETQEQGIDLR